MAKIKVANIVETYHYGGPHKRIALVAERLKKYGVETVVIYPKKDFEEFYNELNKRGIKSIRINLHKLSKDKSHFIKYILLFFFEVFSLYKIIKEEDFDIIHCNGAWQFKGVIAGKLARKRVVWHLNDTKMPFVIKVIFKFFSNFFCDGFIVAGERVKKYYLEDLKIEKGKIIEIQAPVDTKFFNPEVVTPDPKLQEVKGLKIVTVANISPLKGLEYFIESAYLLNNMLDTPNNNLKFFIVGKVLDSQKRYFQKLLNLKKRTNLNNLYFYTNAQSVARVLKAADIYVCSSIAEASPMAVWEAMAMAKSIVSTDVGDVSKFIKNGLNGYIVEIKNSKALADKISLLVKDKKLREKMGNINREIAVKYLDVEICVEKHKEFYKKILNIKNI